MKKELSISTKSKLETFKENNKTYDPELISTEVDDGGFTFTFWDCGYHKDYGMSNIYVSINDILNKLWQH